jgi:hypothetical protein
VFFVAKDRAYPSTGRFGRDGLPVVREGRAAAQPYRREYRSATPGNGSVLAEDCVVGGQLVLQGKVEKNRVSPRTWHCGFFQTGKFKPSESQNYAVENERNRGLKFLQFLEKFSGGISTRGEDRKCRMQKAKG